MPVYRFSILANKPNAALCISDVHACHGITATRKAIAAAISDYAYGTRMAGHKFKRHNYKRFLDQGLRRGDASMWGFTLGLTSDGYVLGLTGMTEAEYDAAVGSEL